MNVIYLNVVQNVMTNYHSSHDKLRLGIKNWNPVSPTLIEKELDNSLQDYPERLIDHEVL